MLFIMANFWDPILNIWLYPLVTTAIILDGYSTVIIIENTDEGHEANPVPAWFHKRLGVRLGQTIFSSIAVPFLLFTVHVLKLGGGLAITSLVVGLYLGFSFRQMVVGLSALD